MLTEKEFEAIFESTECHLEDYDDDNAILGLNIIRKYLPKKGIAGAEHDIIYSVWIGELVKAGITREDAVELRNLNWMLQDGYLACFV